MKNHTLLVSLATSLLFASACASSATRPDGISAGDATGTGFACTPATVQGDHEHFIVDWSDAERAALESAMSRGVAVLSYTCEGAKILKACSAPGSYAYQPVSPKTQLIEMRDAGELTANFGGVPQFPAEIYVDLRQGRSLALAYTLVGTLNTELSTVAPDELEGRCDGATHFVFETQLGAFVLDTAEAGSAKSAVDIMAYGNAKGSSESERSAVATDGNPEACAQSSEYDDAPTSGCKAMLRASLMAIR